MLNTSSSRHATILALCLAATTLCLPNTTTAEEQQTYVFDRMWPTLKQPWYFFGPRDLAVSNSGNLYIINWGFSGVQQFTLSGDFVSLWGHSGSNPGEFNAAQGIAVDANGNLFVADTGNNRVQKFGASGELLAMWGTYGSDFGEFDAPTGIDLDNEGNVYVADLWNFRIQKFSGNGEFITSWGTLGSGNSQFEGPQSVAVDTVGNVYVADSGNTIRIKVFDTSGVYKFEWGSYGAGPGQFENLVMTLELNNAGHIYTVERDSGRMQEFTIGGEFVKEWGNSTASSAPLGISYGITVDVSGTVYLADLANNMIKKFASSGEIITSWSSYGTAHSQFHGPGGIAVGKFDFVYVTDLLNNRVQKFTSSGRFETQWGTPGNGEGEFDNPSKIAIDQDGFVYIVDTGNNRIQKFTDSGVFVEILGSSKGTAVEFDSPSGIAIDQSNMVYIADRKENYRVQKFTSAGTLLESWVTQSGEPGPFFSADLAVDRIGNLYLADLVDYRLLKLTTSGVLVDSWRVPGCKSVAVDSENNVFITDHFDQVTKRSPTGVSLGKWGGNGSAPGLFIQPDDVCIDDFGSVYVTDFSNNRVQKFKAVNLAIASKAIVVAAGGHFFGNDLWDTTQYCANFANRTLNYQGFTKDSIRYFSSDLDLDLDNNGLPDDVNGDATNANLQAAISQWASGADSLVLYLVDHGGDQTFRMSGSETLTASELDAWLDQVDPAIAGPIIVIYDACQSGSFLDVLAGPNRIIITSAQEDESAYFLSTGTISFSSFFWTYVFNGATVQEAFDAAVSAVGQSIVLQNPQISDPDNLAPTTYIGNGTKLDGDAPVISDVSDPQVISGTATAEIVADPVTDIDGVSRVWAVIQPPDYVPPSLDNPVQNLPSIELFPSEQDLPHWSGTYDGFTSAGTYTIAIYATDRQLNTSSPKITSVSVNSPLARKAIILAGGVDTDPLWPAIENSTLVAYNALKGQGYGDDTIRFYSPITFNAGVDGLNALSNLQSALTEWAVDSTQDVVVYLCGNACGDVFAVNATESVSANQLDAWLDLVQAATPGKVVVVIDASNAGQFVSSLTPPNGKSRIVIAGAGVDEAAAFASDGDVSFSNYFWRHVLNGATVEQAFRLSATAIRFSAKGQEAQLDDNGNGIANEKADGILSRFYRIGSGIQLAADDPLIGSVSPIAFLADDGTSSPVFAENVTTTGTIERVWAEITPPGVSANGQCAINLIELDLSPTNNNRFEAQFDSITHDGTYTIAIFAKDAQENISIPSTTHIKRGALAFADIDSNDANDAVDIQLVINAALNFPIDFDADVDRNTAVNAVDVQLVINAALGLS